MYIATVPARSMRIVKSMHRTDGTGMCCAHKVAHSVILCPFSEDKNESEISENLPWAACDLGTPKHGLLQSSRYCVAS